MKPGKIDSGGRERYIFCMRSGTEHNDLGDRSSFVEARLLAEIERTPETSQRSLARRLGVALGITNLLIRNLAQKGYVRVSRAGWRNWVYALTPAGFYRKAQLTVAYIERVLEEHRRVLETLQRELDPLGLHAESRVALHGTGEFAEVVYSAVKALGVEDVRPFAPLGAPVSRFHGSPMQPASALDPDDFDLVIVATLEDPEAACSELEALGVAPTQLVTFFPKARAVPVSTAKDAR